MPSALLPTISVLNQSREHEGANREGPVRDPRLPENPCLCRRTALRFAVRRVRARSSSVAFLLMLTTLSAAWAQDLQISATVDSDSIGVQDQLQLTVTVRGNDSGQALLPRLPRMQGFRVVAGPSVSTRFQWINGRSTGSKSFVYILMPDKEGQFTIDPVEVAVGSRVYKTLPIAVRVTAAARAPAQSARPAPPNPFGDDVLGTRTSTPASDEVFVTAELDRVTAFPGQQVTLIYHLYTRVNVAGLQLQENPPLTGFWVENIDVESKPTGTRQVINGREYLDYVIKKQALFANSPGRLKIPPSTFAISIKSAGDFFGFFGQTETIYRKTKDAALEIKSLPVDGRPEGFNNAVGNYALSNEIDKSSVATGDAVSLRVKLTGKGNLKEIPDIPLPVMPDLAIYSSKREDNVHAVAGDQIGGEKSWEYVIVPKAPGVHTIPPLSFSYFDPEREKYQTLTTAPVELQVAPGADSGNAVSALAGLNKQNLTRQGTDISFIKLSGSDLEPARRPAYYSSWFYLPALLSLLFNAGAFVIQRERARQSGNTALVRRRKAKRAACARLRSAEKAGRAEPRGYYDHAAMALSGYLEDRFNLPEIAVTADTLERIMEAQSVPAETVKAAVAALQECDFGRFVSASSAPERIKALSDRIRKIIDALEHCD